MLTACLSYPSRNRFNLHSSRRQVSPHLDVIASGQEGLRGQVLHPGHMFSKQQGWYSSLGLLTLELYCFTKPEKLIIFNEKQSMLHLESKEFGLNSALPFMFLSELITSKSLHFFLCQWGIVVLSHSQAQSDN